MQDAYIYNAASYIIIASYLATIFNNSLEVIIICTMYGKNFPLTVQWVLEM